MSARDRVERDLEERPDDWPGWGGLVRRAPHWLWRHRRRARDFTISLFVLLFVSWRLVGLSGGVLWVPSEWRLITQGAFLAVGLQLYHRARRRADALGREVSAPVQPRESRLAHGQADDALEARRRIGRRSLRWACLTLVPLCALLYLGGRQLRPWRVVPERALYALEYPESATLDPETGLARPEAVTTMLEELRSPVHLRRKGPLLVGSILIPLGFPTSEDARTFLRAKELDSGPGEDPIETSMTRDVGELIKLIQHEEADRLHLTMSLFVGLHLLIVACAAMTLGYSFSWQSAAAEDPILEGADGLL